MRRLMLLSILFSLAFVGMAKAQASPPRSLQMTDGQILSHGLEARVTGDIPENAKAELVLETTFAAKGGEQVRSFRIPAHVVMRNQAWTVEDKQGKPIPYTGTVLRFWTNGILDIPFYKTTFLVNPRIEWKNQNDETVAASLDGRIGIANFPGIWLWTCIIIVLTVYLVLFGAWKAGLSWKALFMSDGEFSLSRCQALAWTLSIGTLALAFSLQRFETPPIPETLVALMGLSLATTGGSALAGQQQKDQQSIKASVPPKGFWQPLIGMICEEEGELSLPRTQMFFWTIIMIVVFWYNSFPQGIIWEVPWQMVMLMGLSQTGYVAAKYNANKP